MTEKLTFCVVHRSENKQPQQGTKGTTHRKDISSPAKKKNDNIQVG